MTGIKIRFERILHWWLQDLGHCVLQSTNTQHAVQTSRGRQHDDLPLPQSQSSPCEGCAKRLTLTTWLNKIYSENDLTGVTSVLTLAWPPSAWPSTITYWLWCAKISGHEKFRIGLISGTVLMPDGLVKDRVPEKLFFLHFFSNFLR